MADIGAESPGGYNHFTGFKLSQCSRKFEKIQGLLQGGETLAIQWTTGNVGSAAATGSPKRRDRRTAVTADRACGASYRLATNAGETRMIAS